MPDERMKTMSAAYEEFKAQFWQEARNWTNFTIQLAKQRDLVSLKILEKVYLDPGCPLSLIELQRMLGNITRNKMTIWNHVKKLEAVDLVEAVRGKPMFVHPRKGIPRSNVERLVNRCYGYLIGRRL